MLERGAARAAVITEQSVGALVSLIETRLTDLEASQDEATAALVGTPVGEDPKLAPVHSGWVDRLAAIYQRIDDAASASVRLRDLIV